MKICKKTDGFMSRLVVAVRFVSILVVIICRNINSISKSAKYYALLARDNFAVRIMSIPETRVCVYRRDELPVRFQEADSANVPRIPKNTSSA